MVRMMMMTTVTTVSRVRRMIIDDDYDEAPRPQPLALVHQ
jgi:hypothetical protein